MKLKKGDTVLIISGKYRGKKGKVLVSFPEAEKVLVEGINIRKKHQKAKKEGQKGQIIEMPAPISVSNAMLVCPKCGQATRIGSKLVEKKRYRSCKKCGQEI
ncbi:MAG: 50S ribosomal protein L24 [Patescibacteria group bacterium]